MTGASAAWREPYLESDFLIFNSWSQFCFAEGVYGGRTCSRDEKDTGPYGLTSNAMALIAPGRIFCG
jgi:hypothetical protein